MDSAPRRTRGNLRRGKRPAGRKRRDLGTANLSRAACRTGLDSCPHVTTRWTLPYAELAVISSAASAQPKGQSRGRCTRSEGAENRGFEFSRLRGFEPFWATHNSLPEGGEEPTGSEGGRGADGLRGGPRGRAGKPRSPRGRAKGAAENSRGRRSRPEGARARRAGKPRARRKPGSRVPESPSGRDRGGLSRAARGRRG